MLEHCYEPPQDVGAAGKHFEQAVERRAPCLAFAAELLHVFSGLLGKVGVYLLGRSGGMWRDQAKACCPLFPQQRDDAVESRAKYLPALVPGQDGCVDCQGEQGTAASDEEREGQPGSEDKDREEAGYQEERTALLGLRGEYVAQDPSGEQSEIDGDHADQQGGMSDMVLQHCPEQEIQSGEQQGGDDGDGDLDDPFDLLLVLHPGQQVRVPALACRFPIVESYFFKLICQDVFDVFFVVQKNSCSGICGRGANERLVPGEGSKLSWVIRGGGTIEKDIVCSRCDRAKCGMGAGTDVVLSTGRRWQAQAGSSGSTPVLVGGTWVHRWCPTCKHP